MLPPGGTAVHRALTGRAQDIRAGLLITRCGACLKGRAVDTVWIIDRGRAFEADLCPECLSHVTVVERPAWGLTPLSAAS